MKIIFSLFGYGLLIYFALLTGLFLAQRDFLYVPSYNKPLLTSAGIIGMEEIKVQTKDNLTLFGWYKAPAVPEKPTILWFHGNASDVGWSAVRAMPFIKQGYGVLLAEYRGYSSNPGKPTEEGLYADGRAFWEWLKDHDTKPENIILYGESLGSAVALQLAYENPVLFTLVLEAPFTSVLDIARTRYPMVPVSMLLKDRYDNAAKIRAVRAPIIIVHGDADKVVPLAYGQSLYENAPEPKSMIVIQGGGHNDLYQHRAAERVLSLLSE